VSVRDAVLETSSQMTAPAIANIVAAPIQNKFRVGFDEIGATIAAGGGTRTGSAAGRVASTFVTQAAICSAALPIDRPLESDVTESQ
jgi:hypothetical protein